MKDLAQQRRLQIAESAIAMVEARDSGHPFLEHVAFRALELQVRNLKMTETAQGSGDEGSDDSRGS